MVGLFSESYAKAATYVDPVTRQTVARSETETFSGRFFNPPYFSLSLLAGISPGSIPIDGKETPFVVPNFNTKGYIYLDKANNNRRIPPSEQLANNFLKLWSDAYSNPVYPTRAFSDYKNIRARIYVETRQDSHNIIIGNSIITAAQIKSGRLDFLTSLSSTNTEVIYLGELVEDESEQKNPRLEFFDMAFRLDDAIGELYGIKIPSGNTRAGSISPSAQ